MMAILWAWDVGSGRDKNFCGLELKQSCSCPCFDVVTSLAAASTSHLGLQESIGSLGEIFFLMYSMVLKDPFFPFSDTP